MHRKTIWPYIQTDVTIVSLEIRWVPMMRGCNWSKTKTKIHYCYMNWAVNRNARKFTLNDITRIAFGMTWITDIFQRGKLTWWWHTSPNNCPPSPPETPRSTTRLWWGWWATWARVQRPRCRWRCSWRCSWRRLRSRVDRWSLENSPPRDTCPLWRCEPRCSPWCRSLPAPGCLT